MVAFLVLCLLQNVYLCRAEQIGVSVGADVTPIGCAINAMIFKMQLDEAGVLFTDRETNLVWKPRGVRCTESKITVDANADNDGSEFARRVKEHIR